MCFKRPVVPVRHWTLVSNMKISMRYQFAIFRVNISVRHYLDNFHYVQPLSTDFARLTPVSHFLQNDRTEWQCWIGFRKYLVRISAISTSYRDWRNFPIFESHKFTFAASSHNIFKVSWNRLAVTSKYQAWLKTLNCC